MTTSIETARPTRDASATSQPAGCSDFAPGIEAAFPDQFQESDCVVEAVGAPLPEFLLGAYYLNGPARFGFNGLAYRHWLDGDGMVATLRFERNSIHLKSRYIRSRKFVEEQGAGRPLFRTFGTAFAGSHLNRAGNGLESPVNVSIYPFSESLLAFGEQGLPWELDPVTLETRGPCTFNRRLNDASPFSAHPKFDPDTGEMFNFGIFFSAQSPRLYFYCFGPEGLRYRKPVPLDYPCSVHDFSLSKNYAVFYLSPYLLDVTGLLQDGRNVMDSLRWEPERGSRVIVVSRKTGEFVASMPAGNRYCLHLINSFEEGDRLTVDILEFDEPLYGHYHPISDLFQNVSHGGPVRLVIDLKSRELTEQIALDYSLAPDFPAIDPHHAMRPYDEFWMLGISAAGKPGRKFFDQLVHAQWERQSVHDIYQSPPMRYLGGEPVFVGAPNSREGIVLCQEFDAVERRSSFLIFDAGKIADGPVTRISAGSNLLYLGFHAAFMPEPAHP